MIKTRIGVGKRDGRVVRGGIRVNAASSSSSPSLSSSLSSVVVSSTEGDADMREGEEALLRAVLGLDRGLSARPKDVERVETCAADLQRAAQSPVDLESSEVSHSGHWKLIFSSAFAETGIASLRVGPPALLRLGQIHQDIDEPASRLDNVVSFTLGDIAALTLRLSHRSCIVPPAGVSIEFVGTSVKADTRFGVNFPEVDIPDLIKLLPSTMQPPSSLRTGCFNTSYLSSRLRVTRGDRRELRVYIRDDDDDNTTNQ